MERVQRSRRQGWVPRALDNSSHNTCREVAPQSNTPVLTICATCLLRLARVIPAFGKLPQPPSRSANELLDQVLDRQYFADVTNSLQHQNVHRVDESAERFEGARGLADSFRRTTGSPATSAGSELSSEWSAWVGGKVPRRPGGSWEAEHVFEKVGREGAEDVDDR
ncbi:hypothetical protein BV20DRAFT_609474 [Pilatotrama ljubarskyi]|nr:hypothetical protein BV20DRAFT_609474 [Pilatotrama ljubarskyi]